MLSAQAKQSETKRNVTARDNQLFDRLTQTDAKAKGSNQSDQTSKDFSARVIEEIPAPGEKLEISKNENEQAKGVSGRSSHVSSHPVVNGDKMESNVWKIKTECPKKAEDPESVSPNVSPRIPPVPTSSYQFQADWKVLKDTTHKFYQYFKVLS